VSAAVEKAFSAMPASEEGLFALVPVEDVELLERLEDRLDLDAIRAAKHEPAKPWAQGKTDSAESRRRI
jgi:hypothetical protein